MQLKLPEFSGITRSGIPSPILDVSCKELRRDARGEISLPDGIGLLLPTLAMASNEEIVKAVEFREDHPSG
jgi:hypothetical protein